VAVPREAHHLTKGKRIIVDRDHHDRQRTRGRERHGRGSSPQSIIAHRRVSSGGRSAALGPARHFDGTGAALLSG
jgi:hypothetical protein